MKVEVQTSLSPLSLSTVVIISPRLIFLSIKVCIPPEEVAIATKAREIHVCKFVCCQVLSNAAENDTIRQVSQSSEDAISQDGAFGQP